MSEIFHGSPGYPLPGKKSTGTGKATTAPAPGHRDLFGTRWNQVSTSTFHMNLSGKLRLKHVKNQIWWLYNTFFPRLLFRRYLLFPDSWMADDLWTPSQCFTCFMGVLWFRCFFGETVKPLSLRRLPLDLKASPKLTDRSWPQSEKKGKMRKSMVSWNIPPNDDIMINEGFKGKIKLNGRFSRPCLRVFCSSEYMNKI